MNTKKFKILKREQAYQGFFCVDKITLQYQLYAGGLSQPITRELFERGHAVGILLYDPKLDTVVLIEQFRIGAIDTDNPWLIEIVAGIIEPNDHDEMDVVEREIKEETGLVVNACIPIYKYLTSPGGSSETLALYCAFIDSTKAQGLHGNKNENEDIKVVVMSREKALQAINQGNINNASTIIALQWLEINHFGFKKY